ncbi:MAG: RsmB/NOP family class I SAM-dependent RNA methyltransferase [Sulfuricurvum sp.]|uniref:RsmB/NOP family class I SAM-dependent RNA methyltransferase n=1 Tax=Sulfuricurvum sp. TaxID=2025608 RepID=UPI002612F303|nr:RsmB/NOP family class I SAM-dependent RNA methyltransferase [Sulfuricurvum sp.]MDD2828412.1 RsmB/NOP family class I SAM-dependent RNA methyltransferase [Sulfuricurvum sp.]MDD4949417.1 RsmB/NOP family class I SAM-dependent RNA methyltransferase [Sulfuricurvum sp.]
MSLPEAFVERLEKIVPREHFDAILRTFDAPKQVTFRTNPLKTTPEELEAELHDAHITYEKIEWELLSGVYRISPEDKLRLTQTPAFYEGRLYIQNLSSMVAPLLLAPEPEETVLDLAAAPGGKTLILAGMMENTGWLSAVELQRERFFRLCDNLKHQGVTNAHTYMTDGRSVGKKCPLMFDRILLDAPCSSEARFKTHEPKSMSYWSVHKVKDTSKLQRRLLLSAFDALKPGGKLLYSTCSFSPEENESPLQHLLERHGAHLKTIPLTLPFDNIQKPLSRWGKEIYDERIQNGVRILPTDTIDGFFICLLEKLA